MKLFTFADVKSLGHQKPKDMATINLRISQIRSNRVFTQVNWDVVRKELKNMFYFENTTQKGKIWR